MVYSYNTGYDCTGATDKRRPEKLPDQAEASVSSRRPFITIICMTDSEFN